MFSNLSLSNCHHQPARVCTKNDLLSQMQLSASNGLYNTSSHAGFKAPYLSKFPPHAIYRNVGQDSCRAPAPFPSPSDFSTASMPGLDLNQLVSSGSIGALPGSHSLCNAFPSHSGSTNPVKINKIYSHLCQIYQELNKIERENRKRKQILTPMTQYSLLSNNNI